MGEVYRAFDLILNQTVALKFLNPTQLSEAALARFRNEVRIARQVSHPHVCRVYDLGMVEGLHFLSMEYIDGEDLASLLRRIGRLPQDKAIEFTRKICAGLSAAHERGVLHRDLKPANIMIDGRGQPRITDFGLAGLAAEIPLSDLRSGTPAYMAPEQKAGKDVTTRSDLYSLGLVLHEMFTGKARKDTQSNPSDLVKELDPAIERVILRCLEEEPKRRPSSALQVALALPGGDPIAAALAAGETPSPEMVAASQEKEGLSPRAAVLVFATIVVCLIAGAFLFHRTSVLTLAPLAIPPDALAFQAQSMLKRFGYVEPPTLVAHGFDVDPLLPGSMAAAGRFSDLATHRPPVHRFWYRQHTARSWFVGGASLFTLQGTVNYNSPPNARPGMIRLELDAEARLLALDIQPPEPPLRDHATPDVNENHSWETVFSAAGLDFDRFTPTKASRTPPMAIEVHRAWVGSFSEAHPERIRVEAAFWEGRPVFFELSGDWASVRTQTSLPPIVAIIALLILLTIAGAAVVAWNNLRLGRGDRRGASRVGGAVFAALMTVWVLSGKRGLAIQELATFLGVLGFALLWATLAWLLYVALEPYLRRHWPDSLISWSRLQVGRLRDSLVASHVLVGVAVGSVVQVGIGLLNFLSSTPSDSRLSSQFLESAAGALSGLISGASVNFFVVLAGLLMIVVLRLLVRKLWIADVVACGICGVILGTPWLLPGFGSAMVGVGLFSAAAYAFLWLLRRFGLLAVMAGALVLQTRAPLSLASWYGSRLLVIHLLPLVVAAWAAWVILSAHSRGSTESSA